MMRKFFIVLLGLSVFYSAFGATADTWMTTGSMSTARYFHTATLLLNNQVLVTGGVAAGSSAELYNSVSNKWTTTGSMNFARYYHTTTLLLNGQVLVAGGVNSLGAPPLAELYNSATGLWTTTGSMNFARCDHTTTLLPNGQVLVAGGIGGNDSKLTSAELYNPTTGAWTTTESMSTARFEHTATLLPNGQVLVAGGRGTNTNFIASAELYNPTTGAWTTTGSMNNERFGYIATLLPNGQVLVVGGYDSSNNALNSAELYNPTTGTWTTTGSMNNARYYHAATLLADGKILVAGGVNTSSYPGILTSTEIYNSTTGTWMITGSMNAPRCMHTISLLPNNQVLVAGGDNSSVLASAELYGIATPQAFSSSSPSKSSSTIVGDSSSSSLTSSSTPIPSSSSSLKSSSAIVGHSSSSNLIDSSSTSTLSSSSSQNYQFPTLTDATKAVYKNTIMTFAITDFTNNFSDFNSCSLTHIKILSLPANGTLALLGTAIIMDQVIQLSDLENLTFTPTTSWIGSTSFSWNASNGTLYAANSANFTINILTGASAEKNPIDQWIIPSIITPVAAAVVGIVAASIISYKRNLLCFKNRAESPTASDISIEVFETDDICLQPPTYDQYAN